MADNNITYLTEEDLKNLQAEYDNLVHVEREKNKAELAEARSQGDLSENADYDAARERQTEIESRAAELENILIKGNYKIIDTSKGGDTVKIGSTVTLEFLDTKETATYQIVGTTGADPLNGKISNESPLGEALLDNNAKLGDTIEVKGVQDPYKVIVIKIE